VVWAAVEWASEASEWVTEASEASEWVTEVWDWDFLQVASHQSSA
jgi:hypothetical protein